MNKTIETIDFKASPELVTQVDELFNDLSRFNEQVTSVDIYLKRDSEKAKEEYEVQIKVFLPGHEVFADSHGESVNDAAKRVMAKAKKQLQKLKDTDKDNYRPRPDKQL